jgi:hypothetical protein
VCPKCLKYKVCLNVLGAERVCGVCHSKTRKQECSFCFRFNAVHSRIDEKPTCKTCYKKIAKGVRPDSIAGLLEARKQENTPEKIKLKKNQRQHARLKNSPTERIKHKIRSRIGMAVKKGSKSVSSAALLGCTISEYRKYLETKFLPGMNWENCGKNGWHIDHIRPCNDFDLTKPEEQLLCFHFSNTQPLWQIDNLKKGGAVVSPESKRN